MDGRKIQRRWNCVCKGKINLHPTPSSLNVERKTASGIMASEEANYGPWKTKKGRLSKQEKRPQTEIRKKLHKEPKQCRETRPHKLRA